MRFDSSLRSSSRSGQRGIIVAAEGAGPGREDASGFTVRETIPQSHKVALTRIARGATGGSVWADHWACETRST